MEASLQTQGLEARSKLKSHSYSKEVKAQERLTTTFRGRPTDRLAGGGCIPIASLSFGLGVIVRFGLVTAIVADRWMDEAERKALSNSAQRKYLAVGTDDVICNVASHLSPAPLSSSHLSHRRPSTPSHRQ